MEVIWARPAGQGTTVRDVFEVLYDRRHLAYTTIMSTMARLAKKHLLRAEKADAAYVYYPTVTQEEFVSGFVGRILEDLLVNFSGATLERLRELPDLRAASRAEALLGEIAQRRATEEAEEAEEAEAGGGPMTPGGTAEGAPPRSPRPRPPPPPCSPFAPPPSS